MSIITVTSPSSAVLDRWTLFASALAPERLELLDTEDVVAGLIDRSLLQDAMDAGSELDADGLVRLDRADRALRFAAPTILDRTDIALFKDDEPPLHWWWHIEELVLGKSSDLLLDVPQAAAVKGVHPHTVRLAIKDGRLPARRLARGFLVHRRDLERWQPRSVGRPSGSKAAATDTLLESFNAANTSGDFVRARSIAVAIEQDPSTPRRKLAMALACYNADEYERALTWTRRALEGTLPDASRQTVLLVQGRALLALGRPKDARTALRKGARLGEGSAPISAALADAYLALDQTDAAVRWAASAVAQAPAVPQLKYVLARMEWHADLIGDALEHVVECRAQLPAHEEATLLYASILGLLGDRTGDNSMYRRVLSLVDPFVASTPGAAQVSGTALARLGRYKDAVRLVERIAREYPADDDWQHIAVHIGRSVVEATTDGTPQGNRILDRVEAAIGTDVTLTQHRAFALAMSGDLDAVLDCLGTTLEKAEDAASGDRLTVVMAVARSEQPRAALPLIRSLADADPPAGVAQYLAKAALAADDPGLAREILRGMSESDGIEAVMASLALELSDVGERNARESALFAQALATIGADQPAAATHVRPEGPARASSWEGLHPARTASIDDLLVVTH